MKKLFSAITILAATSLPWQVVAHPGHGHENPLSPGHYVANPEHVLPLALTAAVSIIAAFLLHRAATKGNKK